MPKLQTDIKFLKGVGDKRAEVLAKEIGVSRFEDLLFYYPFKYVDRTKIYRISELNSELAHVQIKGLLTDMRLEGQGHRKRLVATLRDDSGRIELVWFKGANWVQKKLKIDTEYVVFGRPNFFKGQLNIPHPEMGEASQELTQVNQALVASYNTTEKMKNQFLDSRMIHRLQYHLMKTVYNEIPESLPEYFIRKLKLMPKRDALFHLHFPKSQEVLRQAQYRLKLEELFYVQLKILKQKNNQKVSYKGYIFPKVGENFNKFYSECLPFELTGAQKKVLREIRQDVAQGEHMNRLVQGDVGSGKTMVALLSALLAIDNGFQVALMAPTEILATQHYETIKEQLKVLNINVQLLKGSTRKKAREQIHADLADGSLQLLIGTHALIEDVVVFDKLGLVIIDEQHRFGVAQRARLWKKYETPPHVLVMTATPIPRTLAMTLYGDLDVSVIDELPPGRKPVKTIHYYDSQRLRMFGLLKEEIKKGRQVYIVYPLIEGSEKLSYKDLTDGVAGLADVFPAPEYTIGVLHGRMKAQEKAEAMSYFVKGITNILVATTVIEVGVNVPNASLMVIENAEKFGLSQLHQLRGRVGRGAEQSYCILMTPFQLSREGRTRIDTMVRTTDGFELAEADLKLRGPGDLEGTLQSGMPVNLRIANLAKDGEILSYGRNVAQRVLDNDPLLEKKEHQVLRNELQKMRIDQGMDWAEIS